MEAAYAKWYYLSYIQAHRSDFFHANQTKDGFMTEKLGKRKNSNFIFSYQKERNRIYTSAFRS